MKILSLKKMKFIWIQVGELIIAISYRKHIKYVEQRFILSNIYKK